jgi:hypothetical protein
MPSERLPEFTSKTLGKDFLGSIEEIFTADRRSRKREILAVAEVNAASLLKGPAKGLLDELLVKSAAGESKSTRELAAHLVIEDSLWLAEILASVSPDDAKREAVRSHVNKSLEKILSSAMQEKFLASLMPLLDEEFKKIKKLKHSYYYRNRSVGAIAKFLTSTTKGKSLLSTPVTSMDEARHWLKEVEKAFLAYDFGEKFTRNSYFSEWDAFLHDALPEVASEVKSQEKTFASRIRTSLSTSDESLETNPRVMQAYRQLSGYVEGGDRKQVDLSTSRGPFELKASKSEGLFAVFRPKKESLDVIKSVEADVLAASFEEEDLPDISTEIREKPGLHLVIRCLAKPDRTTIRRFEEFLSKAVGR